jgi:hypothetical protein
VGKWAIYLEEVLKKTFSLETQRKILGKNSRIQFYRSGSAGVLSDKNIFSWNILTGIFYRKFCPN